MLRRSVPGRHALLPNDFLNHLGPAHHFVVIGQSERRDLSVPVALDTPPLEDTTDLPGIRDAVVLRVAQHAPDVASEQLGLGRRHQLICQQLLHGCRQIVLLDTTALRFVRVLIVDASVVANDAIAVQHVYFGCSLSSQPAGNLIARILQERELNAVRSGKMLHLGQRILLIRIDTDDNHATLAVAVLKLLEPACVEPDDWALGTQERHDHDLRILEFGE